MAEEESFKVTDRRGRASEEPDVARSAERGPSLPGVPITEPPSGSGPFPGAEPRGPTLEGIFVMFASSALISLGEAADPVTGERRVDLEQAREAINTLLLLRDKTSGNRTEQESQFLDQIMYDLQMRFVRAAEAGRPR